MARRLDVGPSVPSGSRKKDTAVRKEGLQVRYDGEFREVHIEVFPIKSPPGERFFLILFEEVGPAHPKGGLERKGTHPAGVGAKGWLKGGKETPKTVHLERELASPKNISVGY
jgi:hypothetical protein